MGIVLSANLWPLFERISTKKSNEGIAGCAMEKILEDMPYEILFEIFRHIPKFKLIEISKMCSKFMEITEDRRLWKDVYIKYESIVNRFVYPPRAAFAFEELYSGPCPVKVIDLRGVKVNPPVCLQTNQEVKVTKLILSPFTEDKVTIEAILAKYQCTELHLNSSCIYSEDWALGLKPEALSKQTSLEVLSLTGIMLERDYHHWLTPVLSYCKKLKTLDLMSTFLTNLDVLSFVKILPSSLEKLFLPERDFERDFEDSFFNLLAESTPNLRELGLSPPLVKCSSLLNFQFLEVLRIIWDHDDEINISDFNDFHMYLIKFPALKTVYIVYDYYYLIKNIQESLEKLRRTLEPRGILVRLFDKGNEGPSGDDILWKVSKTV